MNRLAIALAVLLVCCISCCTSDISGEAKKKYAEIEDMSGEAILSSGGVNITVYFAFKKPASFVVASGDFLIASNGSAEWVYYGKNNSYITKLPEKPVFDYGDLLDGSAREEGGYYVVSGEKGEVWLDKNFLPVKIKKGETIIKFTRLDVNTGISDDEFSFTPPKGAEKAKNENLLSVEEAEKEVNFSILVPSYTSNYTFAGALVFRFGGDEVVNMYYKNGNKVLVIAESPTSIPLSGGESITIGNTSAQIAEFGGSTMLKLRVNNIDITISGNLTRDEIVRIAESLYTISNTEPLK